MKPLFVLVITFAISLAATALTSDVDIKLSGKIAMSIMLLFTSIGHFKFTKGMEMMMPAFIPAKRLMIIATGFIEILAAIGLLVNATSNFTGIILIIFFVLMLPVNISAAIKHVNYEKADYTGKGIEYLWLRVPMQLLFIGWIWYFVFVIKQ